MKTAMFLGKSITQMPKTARLACELPGRVGGFFDENSQLIISHRFFTEEAGIEIYLFRISAAVEPVEERQGDSVYSIMISQGIKINSSSLTNVETTFQTGDVVYFYNNKEELPRALIKDFAKK